MCSFRLSVPPPTMPPYGFKVAISKNPFHQTMKLFLKNQINENEFSVKSLPYILMMVQCAPTLVLDKVKVKVKVFAILY